MAGTVAPGTWSVLNPSLQNRCPTFSLGQMKRQMKNEERQHAEISAFHYLQPAFLRFSRGPVPAMCEAILVD